MDYITDTSYKQAQAEILGSLTTLPVATGSQLVGYSGFKQYAGLREQYNSDLDFGTGEWSCSAWVNVPSVLDGNNFSLGNELLLNPNFDTDLNNWSVSGWTYYDAKAVSPAYNATSSINSSLSQSVVTEVGTLYKISFTIYTHPNINSGYIRTTVFGTTRDLFSGTYTYYAFATSTSSSVAFQTFTGGTSWVGMIDSVSIKQVAISPIIERNATSNPYIKFGFIGLGYLAVYAFDGTNTRITTTDSVYNTNNWLKVEAVYTPSDTALAIRVNGQTVKSTTGTALLSMNNSNAQLTIGNNFDLTAPFPGSIALAKLSATAPTAEQSQWMYEQEKPMFSENSIITLPDSTDILDLAVEDSTSRLIAISGTNESYWSGLRRVRNDPVPAGTYSTVAATSDINLVSRITTDAGVDITIPAYNIKTRLEQDTTDSTMKPVSVFDYDTVTAQTAFVLPIGFTALSVYLDGTEQREGASKQWTRGYDGFKETVTFTTAPGNGRWVQIHASKE